MAIVQCVNHHYYDDALNTSCPYCDNETNTAVLYEQSEKEDNTVLIPNGDNTSRPMDAMETQGYGESVQEYEKTIGIFLDANENILTVGWLVCTKGLAKGKSFPLHAGRNFAGRSLDMDIVLPDEATVSRSKHFSVVYDPKSVQYYLVADGASVYINDVPLSDQCELTDGDEITAGDCTFVFVPFCKEGRVWE